MVVECVVSLYAAWTARSVVLLVFGNDSFIKLLSAVVVLLAFYSSFPLSKERAAQWAGLLLFILAVVIILLSITTLAQGNHPETSILGIGITSADLVIMPILAWLKRKTAHVTDSCALAADAVQSATCAYLAAITLIGLALTAVFHIRWIDAAAALVTVPVLIIEERRAMTGEECDGC
jgi:divalent metal cation (Fe/Co/Zn/Cd) transporter